MTDRPCSKCGSDYRKSGPYTGRCDCSIPKGEEMSTKNKGETTITVSSFGSTGDGWDRLGNQVYLYAAPQDMYQRYPVAPSQNPPGEFIYPDVIPGTVEPVSPREEKTEDIVSRLETRKLKILQELQEKVALEEELELIEKLLEVAKKHAEE